MGAGDRTLLRENLRLSTTERYCSLSFVKIRSP
jgi:hypothetical protein